MTNPRLWSWQNKFRLCSPDTLFLAFKIFCWFLSNIFVNCSWHYSDWAYYVKRQKRKSEFAEWHKRFWFVTFTYISEVTSLLWITILSIGWNGVYGLIEKYACFFNPKAVSHFNIESTKWNSMNTSLYENLFFGKCRLTKCYETIKSNHRGVRIWTRGCRTKITSN